MTNEFDKKKKKKQHKTDKYDIDLSKIDNKLQSAPNIHNVILKTGSSKKPLSSLTVQTKEGNITKSNLKKSRPNVTIQVKEDNTPKSCPQKPQVNVMIRTQKENLQGTIPKKPVSKLIMNNPKQQQAARGIHDKKKDILGELSDKLVKSKGTARRHNGGKMPVLLLAPYRLYGSVVFMLAILTILILNMFAG